MKWPVTANRLKQAMNKINISAQELADKSGVSKSHINDIENGNTHPTVYTLCLLSLALGVDPCSLFTLSDISDK